MHVDRHTHTQGQKGETRTDCWADSRYFPRSSPQAVISWRYRSPASTDASLLAGRCASANCQRCRLSLRSPFEYIKYSLINTAMGALAGCTSCNRPAIGWCRLMSNTRFGPTGRMVAQILTPDSAPIKSNVLPNNVRDQYWLASLTNPALVSSAKFQRNSAGRPLTTGPSASVKSCNNGCNPKYAVQPPSAPIVCVS